MGINLLTSPLSRVAVIVAATCSAQAAAGQQVTVTITDPPRNGFEVGEAMLVRGTASLSPGEYLWVLVHRVEGFKDLWWPQVEGEVDPTTNAWRVHVTFGQVRDIGYDFELAAITVREKEHRKLQDYLSRAMESGDWRPLRMPETTSPPVVRLVKKVG